MRETERVGVEEMCLESESVPACVREIFKRVRSCFFFFECQLENVILLCNFSFKSKLQILKKFELASKLNIKACI